VQLPHYVRFALAFCAGASPSQIFQSDEIFGAVVPFYGELIADDLKVDRKHEMKYFGEVEPQPRKARDSAGCFTI
jgi:hypothetical protein